MLYEFYLKKKKDCPSRISILNLASQSVERIWLLQVGSGTQDATHRVTGTKQGWGGFIILVGVGGAQCSAERGMVWAVVLKDVYFKYIYKKTPALKRILGKKKPTHNSSILITTVCISANPYLSTGQHIFQSRNHCVCAVYFLFFFSLSIIPQTYPSLLNHLLNYPF